MKLLRNKRGFTLIEVLIVLIILGILAGLAVPIYAGQVRRSYRVEALSQIAAIRDAMANFHSMNATYSASAFGVPLSGVAIGYNDPSSAAGNLGGQTGHFNYVLSAQAAAAYTVTATSVASPFMVAGLTVVFNQAGEVAGVGGSTLT